MSELFLARFQFASTTLFHFIFVPMSIGLVFIVALMQTLYVVKKKEIQLVEISSPLTAVTQIRRRQFTSNRHCSLACLKGTALPVTTAMIRGNVKCSQLIMGSHFDVVVNDNDN